jgi:crossover junction endodeoxyribonuclease RusA
MTAIHLRVYGLPAAQGSKRHVGRGVMIESSKRVKPWRSDVVTAALAVYDGPLIEGAVGVSMVFLFARPKGHFGRKGLKPSAPQHLTSHAAGDLDKLCRSTLDGLSAGAGGTLLRDDSQVVNLTASKRYCVGEERPGAIVSVMLLSAA